MERILLKSLKVLLYIVHIFNLVTIIKFIRLHILYYPRMHDLMIQEAIVLAGTVFFIAIHIKAIKYLNTKLRVK